MAVVAAIALIALPGCSPSRPEPEGAAAALAAALASGDFSGVALVAGAPDAAGLGETRAAVFEGLGDRTPAVTVASVTRDEQDETHATAVLHWEWDFGSPWAYDVRSELRLVDGDGGEAWLAEWRLGLLAPDLVDGETLRVQRVAAARGTVLAGDGSVIVEPRPVWHIGIDKMHVEDPAVQDSSARELATALGMDPEAYAGTVAAAGPKAFVEAIVVRQSDPAYDVAGLTQIPGVNAVPGELPLAPTRQFARPILGQVGQATAEIVEESGGAIVAGDQAGLSGLQRQYDEQLRGLPGLTVEAVNGPATRLLFQTDPTPGTPLQTTLDQRLQQAAEDVLAPVPGASAIVALRPSTGEVLAAASGAGGGLSTATVGQYAPGSTFKVASALGLLRAGLTADSPVTCPTSVDVDGREFENFPGYPAAANGDISLRTAFANSCNTAFIGQRDTLSQGALADAARSLGLDPAASLGFPAFLGDVPADSSGTDHAASLIGQGRVLASPLGMATVAASVAAGRTVVPVLVRPASGSSTAPGTTSPSTPLTTQEAEALRALMRAVVTEGGATFLADVPAPEVYAKTGTAQYSTGGGLANHAWMIAIHGDLAVAVFVETGDFGSTTAGPLLEQYLRAAG